MIKVLDDVCKERPDKITMMPPKVKRFPKENMKKIFKGVEKYVLGFKPPLFIRRKKLEKIAKICLPPVSITPTLEIYKPRGWNDPLIRQVYPVWFYYITKFLKMKEAYKKKDYKGFLESTQDMVDSIYLK